MKDKGRESALPPYQAFDNQLLDSRNGHARRIHRSGQAGVAVIRLPSALSIIQLSRTHRKSPSPSGELYHRRVSIRSNSRGNLKVPDRRTRVTLSSYCRMYSDRLLNLFRSSHLEPLP